MRQIKTLLTIVRDNIKPEFSQPINRCPSQGMCSVVHNIHGQTIITTKEALTIYKYLEKNKPAFAKKRQIQLSGKYDTNCYNLALHWWTPGKVAPRLKWLNKQIDLLDKK